MTSRNVLAVCTAFWAVPNIVLAADTLAAPENGAAQNTAALEEITVTAQRRKESLEKTPISITAFTSATIERTGVSNISDLAEQAPNVTFKFTAPVSGASNAASVFIRGIGQSDFALTTDPGVGTYVDGVYVARSVGGVLDVLDLERVEILRGPQGTLFGRNTIGGAISLTSKEPSTAGVDGDVQFTVGSFNQLYLRGDLNLPLSDTLAVRIAASSKKRDGYVHTGFTPDSPFYSKAETNLGNEDRQAIRATFLWRPSDVLKLTLASDYSLVDENNAPAVLVGVTGLNSPADGPISFLYNAFEAPTATLPGFPNAQYSVANFVTGRKDVTYSTGANGTRLSSYGSALTGEWALVPGITAKSITAYHHEGGRFARDADGSPITLTDNNDYNYQHSQVSEELQLNGSALGERLKFTTGLYYFRETGTDPLTVIFPASFGILNISQDSVANDSYAAYGQATFSLTQRLALTAGVRQTWDQKRFMTDQTLAITGAGGTAAVGLPPGSVVPLVPRHSDITQSFSNLAPHVSLDYQLTDDALVFASFSQGFKSGGFNLRYVAPEPNVLTFGPETVNAFEIGAKLQNQAHTLQLNASVFTTVYHDVQLTYFQTLGAPVTENGGNARITGFDLEFKARPTPNFNIGATLGYLDAHYTQLAPGLNAGATTPLQYITLSNRLPNTPRWAPNVDIDYTLNVTSGVQLLLAANGRYSSTVYNDAQNSPYLRQSGYALVGTSVTVLPRDKPWSARLYVDNVTDKRYIVSGDSNFGIGFHEAEYNRPRTYGAGLKYSF